MKDALQPCFVCAPNTWVARMIFCSVCDDSIDADADDTFALLCRYTVGMTIAITDGTRTTYENVTVRIEDVNDYAPTIVSPTGTITIREDFVGDIFVINATDRDALAAFRTSTFAITPLGTPFDVDASTGAVSVSVGQLDYDEGEQTYTIVMNATNVDRSSGTRTVVANVTVQLSDVNDNGPVFTQSASVQQLDERSSASIAGAVVHDANAIDIDTAANVNTVYELDTSRSSPNASDLFSVNPTDGRVIVGASGLDYENTLLSTFTYNGSTVRGVVLTIVA